MSKVKTFFSKIGYADILEKLEAEDSDVDEIVSGFQDEYKDVIATEVKKEYKGTSKEDEEKIYRKVKNSIFQKVKTGLKLADVGNVKDYEDESAFIDAVKAEVQEREKTSDVELKQKFESLTEKYNGAISDLENTSTKLSERENDFVQFQSKLEGQIKTRSMFDKSLSSINFGVSDTIVQDYKGIWLDQIENKFKVDPETGSLTDKDGQFVVDGKRKIGTLDEWLKLQVDSRGLAKQNNGVKAGAFQEGTPAGDASLQKWAEEARENGVSEDTIKTYIANRKPVEKETGG